MIRFFLMTGVLFAVVVACVACTRRGHSTREASTLLGDSSLPERRYFIDETEEEGRKQEVVAVKEEELIEKEEEDEVKEEVKKDEQVERKEDEVEKMEWKEESEILPADTSSLGASLVSLRRFLHHAKRLREKAARRDTRAQVEVDALSLHHLNLQLQDVRSLPRARHLQVVPLDTGEGSAPLTVESSGRSVGGYGDCGGTQALGVFNFLTFMVYSFSLVSTVIALAQGTMADTLIGQIINGLIINKRSFSVAAPGMSGVLSEVTEVLGLVQQVFRGTSRHPRDTRRQQEQKHLETLHRELSVGLVTALLEGVQGPEGLWGQEMHVRECSSPVRSWALRYFTTHANTFLSTHA